MAKETMAVLSSLQLAAKMFQASKSLAPYFKGAPSYSNGYNLPSNIPPYRTLTGNNQPPKPWSPFNRFSTKRKFPGSFKGSNRKSKRPKTSTISYCHCPRLF